MRDPIACRALGEFHPPAFPASFGILQTPNEELPASIVEEILTKYADILRVGLLTMNGEPLTWDTCGSKEKQLQNFSTTFCSKLQSVLPEQLAEDVLRRTVYWVCKSMSFDYVLIEVILLLQQRVGCMSTIVTQNKNGTLVDFCIDVLPGPRLHVYLKWRGTGNIVEVSPETGIRKVKGTFFELSTEFKLPPDQSFVPEYKLKLQLGNSMAMRLASQVWSKICFSESSALTKKIHLDKPLRCNFPSQFPTLQTLSNLIVCQGGSKRCSTREESGTSVSQARNKCRVAPME